MSDEDRGEHWQSCFDVQTQRCVCPIGNPAAKLKSMAPQMASMLRRLEAHFRSDYHCCVRSKVSREPGHDADCILEETATLLRDLP